MTRRVRGLAKKNALKGERGGLNPPPPLPPRLKRMEYEEKKLDKLAMYSGMCGWGEDGALIITIK